MNGALPIRPDWYPALLLCSLAESSERGMHRSGKVEVFAQWTPGQK
jgi:hypothetical protein